MVAAGGGGDVVMSWVVQAVVIAVALVCVSCTKPQAATRSASDAVDVARVLRDLEERPEGPVLLPTIRQTFPNQLEVVVVDYVHRVRANTAAKELTANFPNVEVQALVKANAKSLAAAPDAELIRVARAFGEVGQFMTTAECQEAVSHPGDAASPASRLANAKLLAALLLAERAGLDHPTNRQVSQPQRELLMAKLRADLPKRLQSVADGPTSPLEACELTGSYFRWMGSLPDAEAVQVVAAREQ